MLKIISSVLLIAISGFIGISCGKKYLNRVRQLEQCIVLLNKIKTYIVYENLNTNSLIERLAQTQSLSSLKFISICREKLKEDKNFPVVWNESIDNVADDLALSADDLAPLKQLSEIIGSCDSSGIENGISVIVTQLEHQLNIAREENSRMGSLCNKLGVLTGLATVIVLV